MTTAKIRPPILPRCTRCRGNIYEDQDGALVCLLCGRTVQAAKEGPK